VVLRCRAVTFSTESVLLDAFLPQYREIISLAEEVGKYPLYRDQKFGFDQGLVYPLYLVAKWCRDGVTRRAALKLLQETAKREGFFDGLLMGKTQQWIMNIEEEGLEVGEFIPEERRARVKAVKIDCLMRTATVRASRVGRGLEWDERETVLAW